jgi:hypothetical protein
VLRRLVEAEAGEDGGGTGFCPVGVDIDEAGVDLGDAVRLVRRLGIGDERRPLAVGGKHHIDQRLLASRRLLRDLADAGVPRQRDAARLRADLAGDQAKKRRLAGAVPPDQPGLGAGRQRDCGVVDEQALADPVGEAS